MLILSLRVGESLEIDNGKVKLTVNELTSNDGLTGSERPLLIVDRRTGIEILPKDINIKLLFDAPKSIKIIRSELLDAKGKTSF